MQVYSSHTLARNVERIVGFVGTVSLKHVYEIAKIKATDEHRKHLRLEAIASTIIGTARTSGIQVVA